MYIRLGYVCTYIRGASDGKKKVGSIEFEFWGYDVLLLYVLYMLIGGCVLHFHDVQKCFLLTNSWAAEEQSIRWFYICMYHM